MRNLVYSLKKLTQEILETLEVALLRLSEEKADQENTLAQVKQDSNNLELDIRNYVGERGSLLQQKLQFETTERNVRSKLKLNLNRNLLGELAEGDLEKTRIKLKKTWDDLTIEGQRLLEEKAGVEQSQRVAEGEIQASQEGRSSEKNALHNLDENKLQTLQTKIDRLQQEKENLRRTLQELERNIQGNHESQQKAQAAVEMFEAWIEHEKDYQTCRQRLTEVNEAISGAEVRKSELAANLTRLQDELGKLTLEIDQKKRESREIRKKYTTYQEAPEAELVVGMVEELEERLQALKSEYSGEIKLLEKRKTELLEECAKREKELDKLGLTESDYSGVAYDEGKFDEINLEISGLEIQGYRE